LARIDDPGRTGISSLLVSPWLFLGLPLLVRFDF